MLLTPIICRTASAPSDIESDTNATADGAEARAAEVSICANLVYFVSMYLSPSSLSRMEMTQLPWMWTQVAESMPSVK